MLYVRKAFTGTEGRMVGVHGPAQRMAWVAGTNSIEPVRDW